jgi:ABC-type glycerol-3-phosphate transport system substrate-binding protein
MVKRISRREMMRLMGAGAGAAVLAACTPEQEVVEVTRVVTESETVVETVIVEGTPQTVEKVVTSTPETAPVIGGELEVWTYAWIDNDLEAIYNPWNEAFNALYPDVKVNVDVQGWGGRREKLYAAVAAGEPPDIFHSSNDTLPTYVKNGAVLELDNIVDEALLANFTEAEIGTGTFRGKAYITPVTVSIEGTVYNADILDKSGFDPEQPLRSWDDVFEIAAKVKTDQGAYFETINTLAWSTWIITVHEAGGEVYPEANFETNMLEQPAIDALTRWRDEFANEWCPKEYAIGATSQGTGSLPSYFDEGNQVLQRRYADSCAKYLQKDPGELGFTAVLGYPLALEEGMPGISGPLSTTGWSITKDTQNLAAAGAWMNFVNQPAEIAFWNETTNQTPCGGEAVNRYWAADPCIKEWVARHGAGGFSGKDVFWLWQEGKTVCAPHFQAVALGVEEVEEALAACDSELVQLMQEDWADF